MALPALFGGSPDDPNSGFSTQGAIGGAIGLAGLATDIFGTEQASKYAGQVTQANINIAGIQQQENEQRRLAMQINANRQQTEQIRQGQLKASQAQAAAVNQGGQFSSGAAGGQAQIAGQTAYNLEGIGQNLQIGNTLFDLSNQQSQQEILRFQAQSQEEAAKATSSIGGDILSAAPMLAKFAMFL
jgi:hypothetical protein